jgi:hypothetical protein
LEKSFGSEIVQIEGFTLLGMIKLMFNTNKVKGILFQSELGRLGHLSALLKLQLLCTHCPPQQLGSTAFLTVRHFCVFLSQFFTAVLQLLKVYICVHVE